ncbi:GNAT family N-acetyltransferase [Thermodesulfobacteriota bacterium]
MPESGGEILWKTRRFRDGDEERLIGLTRSSTGKTLSIDQWRWLLDRGPGGKGIFRIGDHDGRAVGQYVILPQRMVIDDREVLGAESLETMTHPDYRKQGMFVTLAKEVYADSAETGVSMVYGFPNTQSHHGFVNRLGFSYFMVPIHVRPLQAGRLVRSKVPLGRIGEALGGIGQWIYDRLLSASRMKKTGNYRIGRADGIDGAFDDLWERSKGLFPNMVVRDRAYLSWRFEEKPKAGYGILTAREVGGALAAYVITRTFDKDGVRQGHIVDLLCAPDRIEALTPLLSEALESLRGEGAEAAACMLLRGSPYFRVIRRLGFLAAPKSLPFIIRSNRPEVDPSGLEDPSRWHITIGDSDFV